MKRLLLILLILTISISCKKSNKPNYKKQVKIEKQVKRDKRLLYDLNGVIINKFKDDWGYYFDIRLTDDKLFTWEVDRIHFENKEVNDKVHFDYLAKKRFKGYN